MILKRYALSQRVALGISLISLGLTIFLWGLDKMYGYVSDNPELKAIVNSIIPFYTVGLVYAIVGIIILFLGLFVMRSHSSENQEEKFRAK